MSRKSKVEWYADASDDPEDSYRVSSKPLENGETAEKGQSGSSGWLSWHWMAKRRFALSNRPRHYIAARSRKSVSRFNAPHYDYWTRNAQAYKLQGRKKNEHVVQRWPLSIAIVHQTHADSPRTLPRWTFDERHDLLINYLSCTLKDSVPSAGYAALSVFRVGWMFASLKYRWRNCLAFLLHYIAAISFISWLSVERVLQLL